MAKVKNGLFFALIITILFSCKESRPIDQMKWIIGTWSTSQGASGFYEQWKKSNDSSLAGKGFLLNEGDTMFSERLRIVQRGGALVYEATVSGQNEGKPVGFKLTKAKENEFTFVNEQHDFPTHIIYKYIAPDSLYARVEGDWKGEFRKQEFFMKRVE